MPTQLLVYFCAASSLATPYVCLFLILYCQSRNLVLKQGNRARLRQPRSDDQIIYANMIRACTSWVLLDKHHIVTQTYPNTCNQCLLLMSFVCDQIPR